MAHLKKSIRETLLRRPRKRWREKFREDLNIMGIKMRQAMTKGRREWRKILFESKV
jgi:hypothetical protein